MNAPRILLDTNIILYWLAGQVAEPLPKGSYYVSVMTEIELLSYPSLTAAEEQTIREFLSQLRSIGLSTEIKDEPIGFRRRFRLRIPDSIIAATAKSLKAILLTNDTAFRNLEALHIQSVRLRE